MFWYFLFCVLCLIVGVYETWDAGKALTIPRFLAYTFTAFFPIMNLMVLCGDISAVVCRKFMPDGIILKGKSNK
jgi:hypothetical protein